MQILYMKKFLLLTVFTVFLFSCNPDGTNLGQDVTVVGTYTLGTILVSSTEPGVTTGIMTNSCIQESTLVIDGNYNFTLTHRDLDGNSVCMQTGIDTGTLTDVGTFGFNSMGNMEFTDTVKNCDFNALGAEGQGIYRFTFRYTIPSATNPSQSTSYEFNFGKTN